MQPNAHALAHRAHREGGTLTGMRGSAKGASGGLFLSDLSPVAGATEMMWSAAAASAQVCPGTNPSTMHHHPLRRT